MPSPDKPSQLTPMLRQYHEIKKQHPGTLLFFRLGDFYELFFDDALIGSREMEITLTARHKERGNPVPMCGVPYHAAQGYIAKLVKKGYRVAICEQTEDPKSGAKLMRREVIRVITPGTALENQLLETKQNCYLASICGSGAGMGLSVLDVSTGEFFATQFQGDSAWQRLQEQLEVFAPREIIFPNSPALLINRERETDRTDRTDGAKTAAVPLSDAGLRPASLSDSEFFISSESALTPLDDWIFGFDHADSLLRSQFGVTSLDGFGLTGREYAVCAAGAAIHYVNETQKVSASHLSEISYFETNDHLVLDAPTVNNLELMVSQDGNAGHSLFGVLDETMTGMGARLLRQWVLRPSVRIGEIETRLDSVEELKTSAIKRDRLRQKLEPMADLERLAENLDELEDVRSLISGAIADDPPASTGEPGMIREGFNAELDELRNLARSGKSYITAIEARERGRTGISSLKVKFNNVFGYFIEISNANKDRVPADYERKQTLVNSERYTTPELKEYETKVLGAEERILELEAQIFVELRNHIAQEIRRIQGVARAVAMLDAVASLAEVAAKRNYVRPRLHEGDEIEIRAGRHPVIETLGERFVPNDVYLNNSTDRLLIVTGPNMGGKSVWLKQTASIVILAQMGSFVPANSAKIAMVDRIFTRVGASDNLARGRSTFMVEMTETSNILNTATPRSLVLLDEVGRGTATFDGLSLAWAIAEYLHDNARHSAKTIFATHYHEMTELAKMRPGVQNYQMAVSESKGEIIFLRKVVPGSASKSYGIEVARLAGLPRSVVERAREILTNLEQNELDVTGKPKFARHLKKPSSRVDQLSLLDALSETGDDKSPQSHEDTER